MRPKSSSTSECYVQMRCFVGIILYAWQNLSAYSGDDWLTNCAWSVGRDVGRPWRIDQCVCLSPMSQCIYTASFIRRWRWLKDGRFDRSRIWQRDGSFGQTADMTDRWWIWQRWRSDRNGGIDKKTADLTADSTEWWRIWLRIWQIADLTNRQWIWQTDGGFDRAILDLTERWRIW